MLNGHILSDKQLSGELIKNDEIFNHEKLYNRNAINAHPIEAITGLKDKLAMLENKTPGDLKAIKLQISRLITSLLEEQNRATSSEQTLKIEINKLIQDLKKVQNQEDLQKLSSQVLLLKKESLELENRVQQRINDVSADINKQIKTLQLLSDVVDSGFGNIESTNNNLSHEVEILKESVNNDLDTLNDLQTIVETQQEQVIHLNEQVLHLITNQAHPENFLSEFMEAFCTKTELAEVKSSIDELKNNLLSVDTKINDLTAVITEKVESTQNKFNTIDTKLEQANIDIENINTNVKNNKTTITANKEAITTLTSKVDKQVIPQLNQLSQDIVTTNTTLTESINTQITDIIEQLNDINTSADLLEENLQKQIVANTNNLTKYINTTDKRIEEITKSTTVISSEIDKIKNNIEQQDNKIASLEIQDIQFDQKLKDLKETNNTSFENLKTELDKNFDLKTNELDASVELQNSIIDSFGVQLNETESDIQDVQKSVSDLGTKTDNNFAQLEAKNLELNSNLNELSIDLDKVKSDLQSTDNIGTDNKLALARLKNITAQQQEAIMSRDNIILEHEGKINNLASLKSSVDSLESWSQDINGKMSTIINVMRFIGITTSDLSIKATNNIIKIKTIRDNISLETDYTAKAGDVVLSEIFEKQKDENNEEHLVSLGYKEFIWTGDHWEKLGDNEALAAELQHHILNAVAINTDFQDRMNKQMQELQKVLMHHILNSGTGGDTPDTPGGWIFDDGEVLE